MKNSAQHFTYFWKISKHYKFVCLITLFSTLILSCNKKSEDLSTIPEDEKLVKSVSSESSKILYEYNPDKSLKEIIIGTNGDKFTFDYAGGLLKEFKTLSTNGYHSVVFTYGNDNRISSFKSGNEPSIIVDYFDDLNRYTWNKNGTNYEIQLNGFDDVAEVILHKNGQMTDQHTFLYDHTKKGPFWNSKLVLPQMYMFMYELGFTLHYLGGMTKLPISFFGSDNSGANYKNEFDLQGFLTKSEIGEDKYIIRFEY